MTMDRPPPADAHFCVEQLALDLPRRAVRSGAAVTGTQVLGALVSLGTVVVLARLLTPADFGLVAMALPFALGAALLRNFGLDLATIHRENLEPELVNLIFWRALKWNGALAFSLAASSPVVAWFFREPRLIAIMLVFAGSVALLSLGAQSEALLKRQMRFGVLSIVALISATSGAVTAVILGLLGAGYWALVSQTAVLFALRGLLPWIMCAWRPQWPVQPSNSDATILRAMQQSGWNLTGTRVLTLVANYSDRVALGWLAGPAILGLYENGRRVAFFALDNLYAPLLDVAVAGFSRSAGDDARYRVAARHTVQMVLTFIIPGLAFLLVEARPAILLLLGERWLPSLPFARLLLIAAFGQSLTRMLNWFYVSRDQTARQMRWFIFQTCVTLAAVVLGGSLGGAYGVALAIASATGLLLIPAIVYGLSDSPFTAADFAGAAARPALLSLGAGLALFFGEALGDRSWPPLLHCLIAGCAFSAIYLLGWIALPGGRAAGARMVRLLAGGFR